MADEEIQFFEDAPETPPPQKPGEARIGAGYLVVGAKKSARELEAAYGGTFIRRPLAFQTEDESGIIQECEGDAELIAQADAEDLRRDKLQALARELDNLDKAEHAL